MDAHIWSQLLLPLLKVSKFNKHFFKTFLGRTMYVIPFSMGPVGSPLAKIGIQLTDSPYVVLSMKIMTRMGDAVLRKLYEDTNLHFVKALHSVGTPVDGHHEYQHWPCDPERTIILHRWVLPIFLVCWFRDKGYVNWKVGKYEYHGTQPKETKVVKVSSYREGSLNIRGGNIGFHLSPLLYQKIYKQHDFFF